MYVRRSNTVYGVIQGLAAAEAITDREAQAYRERFTKGDKSNAWSELVARFGLVQVRDDRYTYQLPTMRGDLVEHNNQA